MSENDEDKNVQELCERFLEVVKEPLPKNGLPHVIVVIYNREMWAVSKAAPKGRGLTNNS